jgi:hypothetical protein
MCANIVVIINLLRHAEDQIHCKTNDRRREEDGMQDSPQTERERAQTPQV